jgi:secondary thiamine-phosphate synthase enzyme
MVVTKYIQVKTDPTTDKWRVSTSDITPQINQKLGESDVNNGTITVFVAGSTAGITTIEYESGVINDFKVMWERAVPYDITYDHDRRWGDGNGYSHVRASLLGASIVIPFSNKKLILGTWQQVILVDFDNRPRSRQVVLQVMGE